MRYSMLETFEMRKHWSRFDSMTPEQRHAAAESDPDAAARAYLRVIARNPQAVTEALQAGK
jgi:hypothetical protein